MTHPASRRTFLQSIGAAALLAHPSLSSASIPRSAVIRNGPALRPAALYRLPLGSIRPLGWLRRQPETQAQGLSGYLDETWPDVGPNTLVPYASNKLRITAFPQI